jgi:hypothetical protein
MRRGLLFAAALFCMTALPGRSAHAGSFMFGQQDRIHFLKNVNFKGPNGEGLYLGYMTTMHIFVLPYRVTKSGYVLGVTGNNKSYYKLSADRIAQSQRRGLLPTPLPPYKLSFLDYLVGYSLWFAFPAFMVLCATWQKRMNAAREAYRS